jgi:hypothetical protein
MTTPSEFKAMRAALDKDLAKRSLTPLQKVQYKYLKELVDNGEEGWVEIVVVPSGGVLSPPRPGENYMTGVAIQQVGKYRHSWIPGTDPYPSVGNSTHLERAQSSVINGLGHRG